MVAKLEVENKRLKKVIGWKELVQTRNVLPDTIGVTNNRSSQGKASSHIPV